MLGALREFLNDVLGPTDDITYFQYTKKHNREIGPAIIGIQLQRASDYDSFIERLKHIKFEFQPLNHSRTLFDLII